jgi:hypothetical protein
MQTLGEKISAAKIRHGDAVPGRVAPEYRSWAQARRRTVNPEDPAWPDYGGRGITMCERWSLYDNFLADMGRKPSPSHTLDRMDNDGPYAHWNCRWATKKEQARNRRSSASVSFGGVTRTVAEWSEVTGLHAQTITTRLRDGWPVERALTQPAGPYRGRGDKRNLAEVEGRQLRDAAE